MLLFQWLVKKEFLTEDYTESNHLRFLFFLSFEPNREKCA